jgi:hypothetical protein
MKREIGYGEVSTRSRNDFRLESERWMEMDLGEEVESAGSSPLHADKSAEADSASLNGVLWI